MAGVNLNAVRKTYQGGVDAVKGVSFDVPDGAFCVLVGPSGCGKSTLLRMIAGLERITSGDIAIGDRIVNEIEPADRDIAMVFQNYALYPHMSVYDNIAYGLKNRKTPKDEIDRRVREAAKILAIEPLLERKPRQLSGGQRQRVAMGRAIVRKPQVFLFDEPLSNLDAKLRVQMRVEIKKLQKSFGVTAIYVTHDQVEAMTMSDILVVMNAGEVEQIGTPTEIYRHPATRFVATFIGSPPMNLVSGHFEADGSAKIGDVHFSLPPHQFAPGRAIELGLRPEDLVIDGPANRFALKVDFIEELGATQLVYGQLGGAQLIVQVPSGSVQQAGGEIVLGIAPDRLHVFDPATGRRAI